MNDRDARELLSLLAQYCDEYAPDIPTTLEALALDLVQTLDNQTDADRASYETVRAMTAAGYGS